MTDIYFAGKTEDVKIPSRNNEDAGYDIYAYFDEEFIEIHPHETVLIPTGLYSAFDSGYFFKLMERGSTGVKGIGQRSGVIDSGYRGEWIVPITNHNNRTLVIIKDKHYDPNIEMPDSHTDSVFIVDGDDTRKCNFNPEKFIVYPYEKAICQAVLLPVPQTKINIATYEEIQKIESIRGNG